jgi:hypothetical protein
LGNKELDDDGTRRDYQQKTYEVYENDIVNQYVPGIGKTYTIDEETTAMTKFKADR